MKISLLNKYIPKSVLRVFSFILLHSQIFAETIGIYLVELGTSEGGVLHRYTVYWKKLERSRTSMMEVRLHLYICFMKILKIHMFHGSETALNRL